MADKQIEELKGISNWDYDYLVDLIKYKVKENIGLEYKGDDWLESSDKGKFKVRKWSASFANSIGGFLVIGIYSDDKTSCPILDNIGININKFGEDNGKWIFDVLANSIFPHLNPIPRRKIIPIPNTKREVIVLFIPKSVAILHKVTYNKDYYFYRHEDQVLQMDEWLVRSLVFGKRPPPVFLLEWQNNNILCNFKEGEIKVDRIARQIWHENLMIRLINDGLGIGKTRWV